MCRRIALVPVYEESGKIGEFLSRFRVGLVDCICLVIDSPCEALIKEIQKAAEKNELSIHLIENIHKMGVGYAIREGIDYALGNGFEVIIVMAGNNKDNPKEIPRVVDPIIKEGYDYVQGSRFLPGGIREKNPILRGVFSRLYPLVWRLLTKVQCSDVTNGFRAYKAGILKDRRINIRQNWLNAYGLEYYIHYKVLTLGYKMKEVAVSKRYPYRHRGGYSKIRPLRDWWDIVRPLIYLWLGVKR